MYIDFEQLPDTSRIWIYQANRTLSDNDKSVISDLLESFTDQWAAHGQPLKSSFRIFYDRFVILAVDDSFQGPSGCSIDDSVRVIKEIGAITGIDFFDRDKILFVSDGGIIEIALRELKEKYTTGIWTPTSITFNTLASTKKELAGWLVEAQNTWLKRYIVKPVSASKASVNL